jgi:hypothetical protein
VVKLVDAGDSKSPAARRAGSIPALGTIKFPSNTQATQRKPAPAERFAGFSFFGFRHLVARFEQRDSNPSRHLIVNSAAQPPAQHSHAPPRACA